MERGGLSFAEDKKGSPQMAFASCPDMVVMFSGPLVQLVKFHVYTILSHLVWLEKFSLLSLEILYNKIKIHSIRFKNKWKLNELSVLHLARWHLTSKVLHFSALLA